MARGAATRGALPFPRARALPHPGARARKEGIWGDDTNRSYGTNRTYGSGLISRLCPITSIRTVAP